MPCAQLHVSRKAQRLHIDCGQRSIGRASQAADSCPASAPSFGAHHPPRMAPPRQARHHDTAQSMAKQNDESQALLAANTDDDDLPSVPLDKCEQHNGVRGVCCRNLKRDQQSHLINPDIVRDVIIGLSDGLTVPFALTAGLSGVGSTHIVVAAGLAELCAGAISMGIGGAISAQAELSHYNYVSRSTAQRVAQSCSGLLEAEVCSILEPFGVPAEIGALVAAKLQGVERLECEQTLFRPVDGQQGLPTPATAPPHRRSDGLVGPERGLTPFLLRMGEGLEKIEEARVWQSAVVIAASYFIGGFIPLLPYILMASIKEALLASIVITGVVLLVFGAVKAKFTGAASDARGLVWGAFSTLLIGAAAAGSSWLIVRALEGGSS